MTDTLSTNGTAKITVMAGAAVAVIGAIATAASLIIGAINENKREVKAVVAAAADTAEEASDNQDDKIREVHGIVNSQRTEMMAELKRLREELARVTARLAVETAKDNPPKP